MAAEVANAVANAVVNVTIAKRENNCAANCGRQARKMKFLIMGITVEVRRRCVQATAKADVVKPRQDCFLCF